MAEAGVRIANMADLEDQALDFLREYFQRQFPVLTPLAVDPSHPFPYISNLSLSLAVTVRDPGTPRPLRQDQGAGHPALFIPLGDGNTFVPLEQVIATHLDKLFPGMDVVEAHPFRVTRDADIELAEDEADDLLIAVEQELRRQRSGWWSASRWPRPCPTTWSGCSSASSTSRTTPWSPWRDRSTWAT